MQFPPTPTPFPVVVGTPPVLIDSTQFRIWAFADDTINWWNRAPDAFTQILQIVIILVIVIAAVVLLRRYINTLTDSQ
jgi:hypothetical protein